MKKNILILGAGRVGKEATKILLNEAHDVTVVDKDEERLNQLSSTRATLLAGDASDTDILEQVGLGDFDEVLAVTGDVEANLASCLIIDRLGYDLEKTLRVSSEKQRKNYESLVDNVIFPESSAARETAKEVDEDFDVLAGYGDRFNVSEVTVSEGSPVAGNKIQSVGLPDDSIIVASDKEICSGATVLETGKTYLVVCDRNDMNDLKMLFNG